MKISNIFEKKILYCEQYFFITVLLLLFSNCNTTNIGIVKTENNDSIFYRTFGKGKPILIINGGPGMNSEGFAYIAEEISKMGYQTIIYDQRGTGKSIVNVVDNQTITMDLMLQDIEDLRKKLNISTWTVFGHSFGGLLATHYAAKFPQHIEKIIFSSSGGVNLKFLGYVTDRLNANLTPLERDSLHHYQSLIGQGDTSAATRYQRAKFLASAYVFDKTKKGVIAQRLTQGNSKVNALVFQNLEKIGYNYFSKFSQFKKPVLVIQGKNDIISVETAQEIHQTFTNSKLVLLDNCAHYGWLDSKEKYLSEIQLFLKE